MGLNYSISIVLPIVTVFFLAFGILEDTGYFPRLTVLTNKSFRFVGVNGKATLPIVLGFGCVTMATLASRILETKKERIIVVTLLALAVPCSAQLGVILALAAALSLQAVLLIAGIIFVEFILVGRIMSVLIKGATSDFILELPPLRAPKISNILLKTWARVKWFLREALPFFLLATFILYLLDVSGGLRFVYTAVRPVVVGFLGLPVETAQVFIVGFFRRDYGAAGLYKLWEDGLLAGNQIVVALLVMSLFLPCLATLIVMIKELGLRWALGILLFVMAMSLLSGGLLNLVLGLSGITI
jgi:ferrous iron transport protein B